MTNHTQHRVRVQEAFGFFQEGVAGLCTADLPEENVYAVMFDEVPPGFLEARWVRFDYQSKQFFRIDEADQ